MRQSHAGGEKLFVDYAGDTVPVIVDPLTGEIREAQFFVAVLGASNYTVVQVSPSQRGPDFIASHVAAPGIGSCHGRSNTATTTVIIILDASNWNVAVASGGESDRRRRANKAANP